MSTVNERPTNSSKIIELWMTEFAGDKINVYDFNNNNFAKLNDTKNNETSLICHRHYKEINYDALNNFLNSNKPKYVIVSEDDGDGANADITKFFNDNDNYKMIRQLVMCNFDFEYIVTVFSTDKSIETQSCVQYERNDPVEWN